MAFMWFGTFIAQSPAYSGLSQHKALKKCTVQQCPSVNLQKGKGIGLQGRDGKWQIYGEVVGGLWSLRIRQCSADQWLCYFWKFEKHEDRHISCVPGPLGPGVEKPRKRVENDNFSSFLSFRPFFNFFSTFLSFFDPGAERPRGPLFGFFLEFSREMPFWLL